MARRSAGRGVRAPPPRDWLQLRQEARDRIRHPATSDATASKQTTTDSPSPPPRKSNESKETKPPPRRLSRASAARRNCVITAVIGDLPNLRPERTNPQAAFLHIRRKEKRRRTNRSHFKQAASSDAPTGTSSRSRAGRGRRHGDQPPPFRLPYRRYSFLVLIQMNLFNHLQDVALFWI